MQVLKISKKGTPQGDVEFKIAFNGKLIAIDGRENPTANQFIQQYRAKGAKVIQRRKGVVINIFPEEQTLFRLGQIEIDFEKDSPEIVENKLAQFYIDTYSKAGFDVERG